jgi:hypothetical protein
MAWEQLVDTASPTGFGANGRLFSPGEVFPLKARSFALFINRIAEKPAPTAAGVILRETAPMAPLVAEPPPEPAGDEDETPP